MTCRFHAAPIRTNTYTLPVVLPAGELIPHARDFATRLANGPTLAYAEIKKLVQASATSTLAEALDAERQAQLRLAATKDFREGVLAQLQRRPPKFRGN